MAPLPSRADYRIGGIDGLQGWSWTGGGQAAFRGALKNPVNFGPSGKVKTAVADFELLDVNPASLALVDCFVAPADLDSRYTQQDLFNIEQFFLNGGDLLLMNDGANYDAIGSFLGVPSSQNDLTDTTGSGKPLFSGPFGTVSAVKHQGLNGLLAADDVLAKGGALIGSNGGGPTIAFWPRNRYAPGAGALIIVSDVDTVASPGNGYQGGMANYQTMNPNAVMALNAVATLILKHPSSGAVGNAQALVGELTLQAIKPGNRHRSDARRFDATMLISCSEPGIAEILFEIDGLPKGEVKRIMLPIGQTELDVPLPVVPQGSHIITAIIRGRNAKSDLCISYAAQYDPNTHGVPLANHSGWFAWQGLCVGMSYTSLRRYNGQVSDSIWNDPLQLDSYVQVTDAWVKLNPLFLAKELEMFAVDLASREGYLLDQIRQLRLALTANTPGCLALGNTEDVGATRHCVVAYALFDLGGGNYQVGIYDPNYGPIPGRDENVVQRVYTLFDANGLGGNLDSKGGSGSFDFFGFLPNL